MTRTRILILGASYGSLLGTKLLMAGYRVSLVCTRDTAALINREGTRVRFPIKGRTGLLEIGSASLPGRLAAMTPDEADPCEYDLIVLGMQEAHYGGNGVRGLMQRIAASRRPCLAIMNMPPLPYLRRLPGVRVAPLEDCYADPRVWERFDPSLMTLASPDPQAFRPQDEPKNVLQVGLPTNFKVARFDAEEPTAMLRDLESGIEAARFDPGQETLQVPVKLKVHDSIFVPLAKWPMLMTGNYRCIRPDGMIPIREAVHGDIGRSREIYDWVSGVCARIGAEPEDLVPFEKYARAAETLGKPSSAARALFGGAQHVERIDRLVREIAGQQGLASDPLREIIALVDERLRGNRAGAEPRYFVPVAAPA
jgi:hypothetical protein